MHARLYTSCRRSRVFLVSTHIFTILLSLLAQMTPPSSSRMFKNRISVVFLMNSITMESLSSCQALSIRWAEVSDILFGWSLFTHDCSQSVHRTICFLSTILVFFGNSYSFLTVILFHGTHVLSANIFSLLQPRGTDWPLVVPQPLWITHRSLIALIAVPHTIQA